jgi:hypothetical protein
MRKSASSLMRTIPSGGHSSRSTSPSPSAEGLGFTAPDPHGSRSSRASLFASVAQACQLANGKAIGRAPLRGGILALDQIGNGFFESLAETASSGGL